VEHSLLDDSDNIQSTSLSIPERRRSVQFPGAPQRRSGREPPSLEPSPTMLHASVDAQSLSPRHRRVALHLPSSHHNNTHVTATTCRRTRYRGRCDGCAPRARRLAVERGTATVPISFETVLGSVTFRTVQHSNTRAHTQARCWIQGGMTRLAHLQVAGAPQRPRSARLFVPLPHTRPDAQSLSPRHRRVALHLP
jgi:hypothetical protein